MWSVNIRFVDVCDVKFLRYLFNGVFALRFFYLFSFINLLLESRFVRKKIALKPLYQPIDRDPNIIISAQRIF